jgi:hypothetical protein
MPAIRLKVTHPPAGGSERAGPLPARPLFQGSGDTDYVCGSCGAVIAARMAPSQHVIVDTATCSGCGAVNEFPLSLRA